MALRPTRPLAIALFLVGLAGCSPVDLGAARQLGQAGQAAFAQLREALLPETAAATDRTAEDVTLQGFVRAYQAFEDLAAYDARGTLQQTLVELDEPAAMIATAVLPEHGAVLARAGIRVMASVAGAVAGEVQKLQVRIASEALRGDLDQMSGLLRRARRDAPAGPLDGLLAEHRKLEAGEPIDRARLLTTQTTGVWSGPVPLGIQSLANRLHRTRLAIEQALARVRRGVELVDEIRTAAEA